MQWRMDDLSCNDPGDRRGLAPFQPSAGLVVSMAAGIEVDHNMAVIPYPRPVDAGVLIAGIGVARHHGGRDIGAEILAWCPYRYWQVAELNVVAGDDNLDRGDVIGKITSGTMSPTLGKAIALGYVPKNRSAKGTRVVVDVRGRPVAAEVVKGPFYRRSTKE